YRRPNPWMFAISDFTRFRDRVFADALEDPEWLDQDLPDGGQAIGSAGPRPQLATLLHQLGLDHSRLCYRFDVLASSPNSFHNSRCRFRHSLKRSELGVLDSMSSMALWAAALNSGSDSFFHSVKRGKAILAPSPTLPRAIAIQRRS